MTAASDWDRNVWNRAAKLLAEESSSFEGVAFEPALLGVYSAQGYGVNMAGPLVAMNASEAPWFGTVLRGFVRQAAKEEGGDVTVLQDPHWPRVEIRRVNGAGGTGETSPVAVLQALADGSQTAPPQAAQPSADSTSPGRRLDIRRGAYPVGHEPPREERLHDPVNHPAHYTSGGIEVIEAIEAWELGFNLGNAVKYIARAGKKDPARTVEDLQKARWYLNREIQRLAAESAKK